MIRQLDPLLSHRIVPLEVRPQAQELLDLAHLFAQEQKAPIIIPAMYWLVPIDFALLCHLLYVRVNATTAETDQSLHPILCSGLAERLERCPVHRCPSNRSLAAALDRDCFLVDTADGIRRIVSEHVVCNRLQFVAVLLMKVIVQINVAATPLFPHAAPEGAEGRRPQLSSVDLVNGSTGRNRWPIPQPFHSQVLPGRILRIVCALYFCKH